MPLVIGGSSAIIGGTIGWSACFAGLGLRGLAVGAVFSVGLIALLARRARSHPRMLDLAGWWLAFVLLTWPVLWVLIGWARYAITGQALGN